MLQGGRDGQQAKAAAQRVGFGNESFFSDLDGLAGQNAEVRSHGRGLSEGSGKGGSKSRLTVSEDRWG